MAGFTNTFEQRILEFLFVNGTTTGLLSAAPVGTYTPFNFFVGLFLTNPSTDETIVDTSGLEIPAAAGYTRAPVGSWSVSLDAPSGEVSVSNAVEVAFPEPLATWGVVNGFGLFTAQTPGTGELVLFDSLTYPITADRGAIIKFSVGNLKFVLD